ncbi:3-phenylpropionate/trans-cinnamate dioxygenase ferredoxin reductase subunit [Tamaricihabitans halophyticus]|uniref:3-phenylpropionate/trans-cinnamate dioxygenase ferredoxin reductase subunit n=1 Tax=Tamaricihabitans halophyticus TaxID=1262583 RepID=A0A4R2QT21_9PSEU|nr:FAD-dependent oxidoreductase [Tamaricihabitans halophyticus]TCP51868.1 3-phenylpropionate/trans-cinnamate dioxygenase ferredoxin reductase subunit [Tamaricihabitans halophyticus]
MDTIAVVGASLAGFSTAQQLRAIGFDGRLVLIGSEAQLPYDRPPLSKGFLTGELTADDLPLAEQTDFDELAAEWELGRTAVALRPEQAAVELDDGRTIEADGVVVATGASPRSLPGTEGIAGIHLLRSLADAERLRADLSTGSPRVAIIGAGFIGAEVAASCRTLGLDTTLIDTTELPLAGLLGDEFAGVCARMHTEHGVQLRYGAKVSELRTDGSRVTGVALSTGELIDADVVLVGIGVAPNIDWLAGSGLALGDGVLCDSGCVTSNPAVVAVGDVANVYRPDRGTRARTEHWTSATQQAATAAGNLLLSNTTQEVQSVPYFWSDQHGVRIQFAGTPQPADEITVVDGAVDDRRFVANYVRDGQLVAVLALNNPRAFARARRAIGRPAVAA